MFQDLYKPAFSGVCGLEALKVLKESSHCVLATGSVRTGTKRPWKTILLHPHFGGITF